MNNKLIFGVTLSLLIGAGGGYWLASLQNTAVQSEESPSASKGGERKVLFYRNPMNPAITSPTFMQDEMGMDYIPVYANDDKPIERKVLFYRNPMNPAITSSTFMQDEMGMDYIPVYADGNADTESPAGTVSIDPVVVQNIGVRTARAEQRNIARSINALGRIDFNEERLARLHPKTSGWIEKLHVDKTGAQVKEDTILLSIYSPDLVAAQREYLVALKNSDAMTDRSPESVRQTTKTVLESALDRLELLDVPDHQLKELQDTRKVRKYLHIHSPFKGTVMNIGAREGQYVTPKDELYMIADLQKIWVNVDVYEDDMPWVSLGDDAVMKVRAAPGREFIGKVSFIYPYLEGKTRTIHIRLEFDNNDNLLKPGMFANVLLRTDKQMDAIVVPSSAIVRSGNRDQVFVVKGEGKFEPRDVLLGLSAEGSTQIMSGLQVGDEVVTSSTFLIDSESKLREVTAKMLKAQQASQGTTTNEIHDMSMDDMSMDDMKMDDMSMDDMDMSTIKNNP